MGSSAVLTTMDCHSWGGGILAQMEANARRKWARVLRDEHTLHEIPMSPPTLPDSASLHQLHHPPVIRPLPPAVENLCETHPRKPRKRLSDLGRVFGSNQNGPVRHHQLSLFYP